MSKDVDCGYMQGNKNAEFDNSMTTVLYSFQSYKDDSMNAEETDDDQHLDTTTFDDRGIVVQETFWFVIN